MKHKLLYTIVFLFLLFPGLMRSQCMSAWGNFMPITITNPNALILTNFQVKLNVNTAALIGAGQMQASGNDIRFTDAACNNIHYWIESGINTANTFIWVKVPTIPASGSTIINMYFGNVSAPAVANGDSVFLFFDEFSTASLDLAKWTVRGTPSAATQSGGILTFTGNSNWEYIRSNTTWNGPVVIESRESTSGPSAAMVLGYAGTDNRFTFRLNSTLKGTTFDPDVSSSNAWFDGAYPGVPHPSSGYNNYEVKTNLVGNIITISSFCDQTTANCNTTVTSLNSVTGTGYYVGFSSYSASYIEYVDWVFARSSVGTQPSSSNGPPQTNAVITTSALSASNYCVGSSLTVNFNAGGTYIPGNIFSAQLSDATGSFVSPVVIGTLNSSSSGPLSLSASIPVLTPFGNAYRIRVVSSTPVITGGDNGSNITINALPTVSASTSASAICIGSSATLTASGASTYAWSSGGNASTEIVTPVSASTYTVTGTDVNGCVNTATIAVTVNALPTITANTSASAVCFGDGVIFTGGGASTYTWTGGVTNAISFVPTITDTYTVTGTDINGCQNTATATVVVNALPTVSLGNDVVQCAGTVMFDAGNVGSTYLWSDASAMQTITVSVSGTYFVAVTDANGCSNSDTVIATINALPTVNLGADVVQCAGTVTFDASNAGSTYLWSDASTNQTLTVSVSGTYSVIVTDINGCTNSDVVVVTINALPTVNLGIDTTNCGAVMLDAGNAGATFLWSDASTTQTFNATTSGTYYVDVTDANGCVGSDTIAVTIYTPPIVSGTVSSSVVCVDDASVTLTGNPVGGTWTGPGVTGSSFSPAAAGVGVHTLIYGFTDSNGCYGEGTVSITVNACVGVVETTFANGVDIFPNPNAGSFVISLNATIGDMSIEMLDMQGRVVFSSMEHNVQAGFSKQVSTENLSNGIYMLRLTSGSEQNIIKISVQK